MAEKNNSDFDRRCERSDAIRLRLRTGEIGVQAAYDAFIANGSDPRVIRNSMWETLGGRDCIGSKEDKEANQRASKMLEGLIEVPIPPEEFDYVVLKQFSDEFENEPFLSVMVKLVNNRISADEAVKGLMGQEFSEADARTQVSIALAQVRAADERATKAAS